MNSSFLHLTALLLFTCLGILPATAQTYQFDNIESCTIVSQSPQEIVFDIRYYYGGKQRRAAFLGVEGYEGEVTCDYLSCQPVRLRRGQGVARVSLAINERAVKRYQTTKIGFFLYHQGQAAFAKKHLILKRQWIGRQTPIRPAAPVVQHTEYAVCFPDVVITARRDGSGISITSGQTLLADGTEWDYHAIQPGVFSLRRKSWSKRNWTVDTNTNRIFESKARLRGFLRSNKALPFRVQSFRDRCSIHLGPGRLINNIAKNTTQLQAGGYTLSDCACWTSHCIRPDLYHLRHKRWRGSFWAADLTRKKTYSTRSGRFQKPASRYTNLPYTIEVK